MKIKTLGYLTVKCRILYNIIYELYLIYIYMSGICNEGGKVYKVGVDGIQNGDWNNLAGIATAQLETSETWNYSKLAY